MLRKSLIALTAAAALSLGFAASAQAQTNLNIALNLGGFGYYDGGHGGGYGGGYYDAGYDENCGWQMVKKVKWNWNHTKKIVKWKKQWVCY